MQLIKFPQQDKIGFTAFGGQLYLYGNIGPYPYFIAFLGMTTILDIEEYIPCWDWNQSIAVKDCHIDFDDQ